MPNLVALGQRTQPSTKRDKKRGCEQMSTRKFGRTDMHLDDDQTEACVIALSILCADP